VLVSSALLYHQYASASEIVCSTNFSIRRTFKQSWRKWGCGVWRWILTMSSVFNLVPAGVFDTSCLYDSLMTIRNSEDMLFATDDSC
jgi:hypothetical protein